MRRLCRKAAAVIDKGTNIGEIILLLKHYFLWRAAPAWNASMLQGPIAGLLFEPFNERLKLPHGG